MGSGPLIVGLGGAGISVAAGIGAERLLIDTDLSSRDKFPEERIIVLGESILRGEGAGRNLKLGMIAIRSGIEEIAKEVSGSYPLLIVAGSEGGTGLAGAVELNSYLGRRGIPRFTFLLSEEGPLSDPSREAMSIALLSGPIRPGILVPRDRSYILPVALSLFSKASSPTPGIRITPDSWSRIGSAKGAFELEIHELTTSDIEKLGDGSGPSSRGISIAAVEAPSSLAVADIKKAVNYIFGNSELLGLGIVETGSDRVTIASISQPINLGPLPSGGTTIDLSELIGGQDLDPGKGPGMLR